MSDFSNTDDQLLKVVSDDLKSIANKRVFPVLLETILWALYSVLIIIQCIKYRKNARGTRGVFIVSLWLYVLCTTSWALDVSLMWSDLYQFLPDRMTPAGTSTSVVEANLTVSANLLFVRSLCQGVIFIFCDIVALWRAYVIYGRPRWFRAVAVTIFVLSTALYIFVLIFHCADLLLHPPAFVIQFNQEHSAVSTAIGFFAFFSTVCAHTISTALIVRKACIHYRDTEGLRLIIARGGGGNPKSSKQIAVLYIVIESGTIYTLLWVVFVLTGWYSVNGYSWSGFWMCQISGMYPTLVVVVVMLRDSLLERSSTMAYEPVGVNLRNRYAVHGTGDDLEVPRFDVIACSGKENQPLSP